jgi:fucose permease
MIAFWVACLGLAVIGLPEGSLGVAWPSIRIGFGLSESTFGLILICMATGTFCAGLVSGHLLELRGPRRVLCAAAACAASALCVIAVSPAVLVLCAGALLLGLGLGTIDSGLNATAALTFDARRINWIHGCYSLGAMAGPLAMTAIIVWLGSRGASATSAWHSCSRAHPCCSHAAPQSQSRHIPRKKGAEVPGTLPAIHSSSCKSFCFPSIPA